MSFSSDIKQEISLVNDGARHCRLALLASLFAFCGALTQKEDGLYISWSAENQAVCETARRLLWKLYGADAGVLSEKNARNADIYVLEISKNSCPVVFTDLKCEKREGGAYLSLFTAKSCCKKAALRGAFLSSGTLSNPDKFYHFEISVQEKPLAEEICSLITAFGITAKVTERKTRYVVYVKDSSGISDLCALMGATRGMLELENARVLRQVRGDVNRKVNCETANLNKLAGASARAIEDIQYIYEKSRQDLLINGLDVTAGFRIKYPEYSLGELGSLHEPPVSKSGVNHRLKKISAIADELRRMENGSR